MVLNSKRLGLYIHKGLSLFFIWSVRAVTLFVLACSGQKEKSLAIDVLWENERATGVIVPSSFLDDVPTDSITSQLHVYLSGMESRTAILGDYQHGDEKVIFKPLIPFTPGLTYEVSVAGKVLGKIQIPPSDLRDLPQVEMIYPSQDTLPENLLKIYISFSKPMREGQALKYVTLLKNGADTVEGTFLDLQPELWNKDYTMLTLWLDPGRIKRDLQPNKRLGVPLESSTSYTLIVRSGWPDTRGAHIGNDFIKKFFVAERDSTRPDLKEWRLKTPEPNTTDPLVILLNGSLDGVLLQDALQVTDSDGTPVNAQVKLKNEESIVEIVPESQWQRGSYVLQCEGRLEDLAGNNLNRLFDRDITKDGDRPEHEVYTLKFEVH